MRKSRVVKSEFIPFYETIKQMGRDGKIARIHGLVCENNKKMHGQDDLVLYQPNKQVSDGGELTFLKYDAHYPKDVRRAAEFLTPRYPSSRLRQNGINTIFIYCVQ